MSEIIMPEGAEEKQEKREIVVDYKPKEEDEERFFLIYHMNIQPSEAEALNQNYRRWLIARFMQQKAMEQEALQRHRLMEQIGPNLKLG